LSLGDAGDGGGGDIKDTKDNGMLVEIGIGIEGFNQTAGEHADEVDLFEETGNISRFYTREITLFKTAGVKAVFEIVHITKRGAVAIFRSRRHRKKIKIKISRGKDREVNDL
jgi:hypothetical protein